MDTTPDTTTTHPRAHYPEVAEKELQNTRDYISGQGAVWRAQEAKVKRDAALNIYLALQMEIKNLDAYGVPLSERVRIMRQIRALEELANL